MRSIHDLIARRRPSGSPAPVAEPEVTEAPARKQAAAPEPTKPVTMPAEELIDDPVAARGEIDPNRDLHNAQEARDFVPVPPGPTPDDRPDWTKRVNHGPRGDTADAAEQQDCPAKLAPTPSKQKVWDLEEPKKLPPLLLTDPEEDPDEKIARPKPAGQDIAPTPPVAPIPQEPVKRMMPQGDQPTRRPLSSRAKTRLLGFHGEAPVQDIFSLNQAESNQSEPKFPIGWIVVIDGPGRGASFTLTAGLSTVGRDTGQTVSLDFGDPSISRENHVAIAYDEDDNRTFVGHGGKSNIVRHNGKPLLTTEDLNDGDTIKIGKTTLRFVAFCTEDFSWGTPDPAENAHD